ncbi:DNA polymerase alpha subunit B-like [Sycon ciliatum]|uniref:DNA polymerase alpha subunit B-like n=1 Tax=Sycon ciliatum TaxID=27933 RepID=UPI0031F68303
MSELSDILGAYGASADVSKSLHKKLDDSTAVAPVTTPHHKQSHSLTRRRQYAAPGSGSAAVRGPDTPSSFTNQKQTPASQRFESRQNSGTVSATLNDSNLPVPSSWRGTCSQVCLSSVERTSVVAKPYAYMFQKVSSKVAALDDWLAELEDHFAKALELPDRGHPGVASQTEMTTVGRVCCDCESERVRANASSLVLECSSEFAGCRVPLNLKSVTDASLFPGQVVALDGMNTVGNEFCVSKVHKLPVPPLPAPATIAEPLSIAIAAGPFSVDDNLTYQPLIELMAKVAEEPPDVLLLIGPFVDTNSEEVKKCSVDMLYDDFFRALVEQKIVSQLPASTHLVLVPSSRDIHHHSVYPQPPFASWSALKKDNIHLFSDPACVSINGVVLGWTSVDVLMQLNRQEVVLGNAGDKQSRLPAHILQQRSFCPTFPPPKGVNMEVDQLLMEHNFMPCTPHVLILPSDFTRGFIKNVNGCVCINPSRLSKGLFSRMLIKPSSSAAGSSLASTSVTQLVNI